LTSDIGTPPGAKECPDGSKTSDPVDVAVGDATETGVNTPIRRAFGSIIVRSVVVRATVARGSSAASIEVWRRSNVGRGRSGYGHGLGLEAKAAECR
jgi:hypothetical protein